ncbi:MAG: hypothetical protein OHK0013_18010 [Sandaracinaceae bacterium]
MADHVAHGMHRRDAGRVGRAHSDRPVAEHDTHVLEAEPGHVRVAPDREEHGLGLMPVPAFGVHHAAPRDVLHPHHLFVAGDAHARLLQLRAHEERNVAIEAREHVVVAGEDRHLHAERCEDAGKLETDVARTHHDEARGQPRQREHVVADPAELGARDRRPARSRAGGDEDVPRADRARRAGGHVAELHRLRRDESCSRAEDLGAGAAHDALVDTIQSAHFARRAVAEGGPIEARALDLPPEPGRPVELAPEVRAVDEELLGHAPHVDAGAAETRILREGHPRAERCRDAASPHAAGAAADHEEVEVVSVAHRSPYSSGPILGPGRGGAPGP